MQHKLFIVTGRVQGVGFRFFTLQEAGKIGIKGYVRNREEGSVEVVAVGSESQMVAFRNWLQKGPPTAVVHNLIEQNYQGSEQFERFEIRH
ncbi:acylphosphatase [Actinobacillus vicugnae]|uniref:acylphosphatase n=1 Tax=Actinobacillus vicugnae TaxID=2573093 RepID=UPI001242EC70|nr:acylphosphatase [Actinobacillus vicugnae]